MTVEYLIYRKVPTQMYELFNYESLSSHLLSFLKPEELFGKLPLAINSLSEYNATSNFSLAMSMPKIMRSPW